MFKFEKLEVWKKAMDFADTVYSATKGFPDYEKFGLSNQMRRAAVSVSANLAEGSSRSSDIDFARFVEISYGSLLETVSESEIARRQGFVTQEQYSDIYNQAEEMGMMLSGLLRKLRAKS